MVRQRPPYCPRTPPRVETFFGRFMREPMPLPSPPPPYSRQDPQRRNRDTYRAPAVVPQRFAHRYLRMPEYVPEPDTEQDLDDVELCVTASPVLHVLLISSDGEGIDVKETILTAYFPLLWQRVIDLEAPGMLQLMDPVLETYDMLKLGLRLLGAPGSLDKLLLEGLDVDESRDVTADERRTMARKLDAVVRLYDKWGPYSGARRLQAALRLVAQRLRRDRPLDAATVFVLACRANDAAAAFGVLAAHRRAVFPHAGTRATSFAKALRRMPLDCDSEWLGLLPLPYRWAVRLAGELWCPIKQGEKFAQGFLDAASRLVYGFAGE